MYYAMSFQPRLSSELSEGIDSIRRAYDPAHAFAPPHITVLFPVPARVGETPLIRHIQEALEGQDPITIRLGILTKSPDHWLFLTPTVGAEQIERLHDRIYSGSLEAYWRKDIPFVPHLSLGHFLKQGAVYQWDNPRESDFDRQRYEEALSRAKALPLPADCLLDRLLLRKFPKAIVEWQTGAMTAFPHEARAVDVHVFQLTGRHA